MSIDESIRVIVQEVVREELGKLQLSAPPQAMATEDTYPPVMTTKQVAELLGTSRQRVYELYHSGQLKAKRVGRTYVFRKEWVLEWLQPTPSPYR